MQPPSESVTRTRDPVGTLALQGRDWAMELVLRPLALGLLSVALALVVQRWRAIGRSPFDPETGPIRPSTTCGVIRGIVVDRPRPSRFVSWRSCRSLSSPLLSSGRAARERVDDIEKCGQVERLRDSPPLARMAPLGAVEVPR